MKWEYKRIRFDDTVNVDDLNKLGQNCWEVVFIMSLPYGTRIIYDVYLKREVGADTRLVLTD